MNVPSDSFFNYYKVQKEYFGFAKLDVTAVMNDNDVTVSTRVTPAIDLKGDYRLALIVTEDGVNVDDSTYSQKNYYAGGLNGPMGGYENKPVQVPASQMVYDYVARMATPSPEGLPGVLPVNMITNQPYDVDITVPLDPSWNKSNLRINALLIRKSDSIVLNSNHVNLPLSIASITGPVNTLKLFPNPAGNETHLRFDLKKTEAVNISVTDITGRVLYDNNAGVMSSGEHQLTIPTASFNAGIYIMTLKTPSGRETIKLEVL
jgi:Secretion system C-terminal sorting domain/Outer membrane protein Omp28